MYWHSTKRYLDLPIFGMNRRFDMRSQSLCREGNRSALSQRRSFWERRWKHFGDAAKWTFRPVTILKTLLLSLRDDIPCYRRLPSLRESFGVILPKQQRRFSLNLDLSMCFRDSSWIESESLSFRNVSPTLCDKDEAADLTKDRKDHPQSA